MKEASDSDETLDDAPSTARVEVVTNARRKWSWLVALTLLACVVRLFRLSLPSEVVFDEVHFVRYVWFICRV